jgi:hypothetical protein
MVKWAQNRALAASPSSGLSASDPLEGEYDSSFGDDEGEDEDELAASNGKGRGKTRKSLLRKINSPASEWLVFGLVIEQLDLAELGLSYATCLRVFLHKKTLAIRVSRAETGLEPDNFVQAKSQPGEQAEGDNEGNNFEAGLATISDEIHQLFQHYRDHYQARDISVLLKLLVGGLDSFPLRRLGGVYFVPQQHRAALENLRKLVEDLPSTPGLVSDNFMLQLPILDGSGAKKQLAQAAYHDFLQELSAMQADLDHLTEEAAQHQLRPNTVAGRLTQYRELKAKAEVYADLLDMQQDRIQASVEKLTGQAAQLLETLADLSLQGKDHQQSFDWDSLGPEPVEEVTQISA